MHRNRQGLVDVQGDALLNVFLEPFGFDFNPIVADGEFEQYVVSVMIGDRSARQAGLNLRGRYQRISRRHWDRARSRECCH
jgi:hypothetical protein